MFLSVNGPKNREGTNISDLIQFNQPLTLVVIKAELHTAGTASPSEHYHPVTCGYIQISPSPGGGAKQRGLQKNSPRRNLKRQCQKKKKKTPKKPTNKNRFGFWPEETVDGARARSRPPALPGARLPRGERAIRAGFGAAARVPLPGLPAPRAGSRRGPVAVPERRAVKPPPGRRIQGWSGGGSGAGRAPGEETEHRIAYLAWAKGTKRKTFRWEKHKYRNPPRGLREPRPDRCPPPAAGKGTGGGFSAGRCAPGQRWPRCPVRPAVPRNPEINRTGSSCE